MQIRWKLCVYDAGFHDTDSHDFAMAASSIHAVTYSDSKTLDQVKELVEHIKSTFSQILQNTNWMSASTKRAAKLKLQNMKANIGYPKESSNKRIVDQTYQGAQSFTSLITDLSMKTSIVSF